MITLSFHSYLRMAIGCKEIELDCSDISVREALLEGERIIGSPFVETLMKQSDPIHRPMILIDGRNIHQDNGYETIIPEGAHLTVLPLTGGG